MKILYEEEIYSDDRFICKLDPLTDKEFIYLKPNNTNCMIMLEIENNLLIDGILGDIVGKILEE